MLVTGLTLIFISNLVIGVKIYIKIINNSKRIKIIEQIIKSKLGEDVTY